MSELTRTLRDKFLRDKEYAQVYMEAAIDAYIAIQIKTLRDQHAWSQEKLATEAGMKQERISVLENVNYSSWSIGTLRKLARAFDVVLTVSFEKFGTELPRLEEMEAERLRRTPREQDLSQAAAEDIRIEKVKETPEVWITQLVGSSALLQLASETTAARTRVAKPQDRLQRAAYAN